jgi:hypothetical protein
VRERPLERLPASSLYVGRTRLTLGEVRAYSAAQRQVYELHANDCRCGAWRPGPKAPKPPRAQRRRRHENHPMP